MFKTTPALILRVARYKEADRILTILTPEDGRMTVKARGALRKGSHLAAQTDQLCYSELTLFGNRGRWTVNEANRIEDFHQLRQSLSALALGCYFAECLEAFSEENIPEPEMLQLGLNSLYALSRGLAPESKIKAVFEWRLAAISGYEPDLLGCSVCGNPQPEKPLFSLENGDLVCASCQNLEPGYEEISQSELSLMREVLAAQAKKMLSFTADPETMHRFTDIAERYFLRKAERRFGSLDYWRSVRLAEPLEGRQVRTESTPAGDPDSQEK
jgi:DNA repair protein RecO (recombination protein O)